MGTGSGNGVIHFLFLAEPDRNRVSVDAASHKQISDETYNISLQVFV